MPKGPKRVKVAQLRVKAAGPNDNLSEGQFEGYASVFGNEDSYGDVVESGAFTRTLSEWAEKGATIPVLWGHDMYDPFSNIGSVTEAVEDDTGLKVTGQLDLDNPTAKQVYRLLKGRRVNSMSFAYAVKDGDYDEEEGIYTIKDADLYEVSIVQVPANEEAEILSVKQVTAAVRAKAGRTLSVKNETALREARDAIDSVLKSLEPEDSEDQAKASENHRGASDEDPLGKSSAQDEGSSVEDLAAIAKLYELKGM